MIWAFVLTVIIALVLLYYGCFVPLRRRLDGIQSAVVAMDYRIEEVRAAAKGVVDDLWRQKDPDYWSMHLLKQNAEGPGSAFCGAEFYRTAVGKAEFVNGKRCLQLIREEEVKASPSAASPKIHYVVEAGKRALCGAFDRPSTVDPVIVDCRECIETAFAGQRKWPAAGS